MILAPSPIASRSRGGTHGASKHAISFIEAYFNEFGLRITACGISSTNSISVIFLFFSSCGRNVKLVAKFGRTEK